VSPSYCPFCGGRDLLHDPGCGLKPDQQRVFACETCYDTGEIEVITNLLEQAETIACPDCGFPKDQGYGVPSV